MKRSFIVTTAILMFIACNNAEENTGTGNAEGGNDTTGDTRGLKGTGVDNTGGTPGPGTITDTSGGKTDTADHTSRKDSLNRK